MKDSEGTEIKLGSLLRSSLFIHDKELDPLWVVGITDMTITMRHTQEGSNPIVLDQAALDASYWIVAGFSRVEK